ncbi:MAG: asparagine synthase (glutamine-hydrolyzing) [Candidatus Melainabacteria bacterium]|nr:asparagine synthase (glutamine-hydrolyzing) [Candidatus Melainabacteria bacterium]
MCGIFAVIDLSPEPDIGSARAIHGAEVLSALRAMRHRGPDGLKYWLSDDGKVALGHARLAIIAVADGDQPLSSSDDSIKLVLNGELYNHRQELARLKARGHRPKTSSDSELAIYHYVESGLHFFNELRGEFAGCLYDSSKNRLLAFRDRFGIKPLCYTVFNNKLYIASEAKALFAAGVPAAIDEESVFHTLNMQYTLPNRTIFANIKQLEPGSALMVENGTIRHFSYFDLNYPPAQTPKALTPKEEQALIQEFKNLLEEAVKLRLEAEFPVVCHLSGGLDSASVLALAAKHSQEPMNAFTVSFAEEGYDELAIAKEMAQHCGAALHTVPVSNLDLITNLEDACYLSEGLAINGHLSAKHLLNKAIHQAGFRVSLTGEGSDEVLLGYPHLRSDLLLSNENNQEQETKERLAKLHAENPMSQGIMLAQGDSLSLKAIEQALGFLPAYLKAKGTMGYKLLAMAEPTFLEQFNKADAYRDLIEHVPLGQLRGKAPLYQSLYLWSKTALAGYILRTLGDGVEMGQSLEGRLPFLDNKLFDFLREVPISMKIKGETEKFILKEALKSELTETIYKRHKHPFVAPPVSRFADQMTMNFIKERISDHSFKSLKFFDQKKLLQLIANLDSLSNEERAAQDPVFMMALSYQAIYSRFSL